ncbi:MAG: hypothetical protein HKN34_02495 [Gammaproteobacteria bacterium]|nr:hypothetical protein [Gammaproteobacteria bacterium]
MSLKAIQSRSFFLLWLIILIPLSACVDTDTESRKAETKTETAAVVEQAPSGPPQQNSGRVKSVDMASGYSYIEVDISGETFWLATAVTAVKPGDEIAWNGYAMMKQFKSKGLNREFDQILFVDRVFEKTAVSQQTHKGKVIEALNSAGYTYIQVEENGKRVWLAAPQSAVEAGQLISWNSTSPMRNFNSPSLNRTFDEIYFVSGISQS